MKTNKLYCVAEVIAVSKTRAEVIKSISFVIEALYFGILSPII